MEVQASTECSHLAFACSSIHATLSSAVRVAAAGSLCQSVPSAATALLLDEQLPRTRMDSKLLYPNFHAEMHRYNAAPAPSASNSLKNKQQQPTPSRGTTSSGSRPNSSSSSGYHKETSGSGHGARPSSSSSSSPQKYNTSTNASNNARHHIAPTVSTRRRMLPPCVPTATAASKYAVASDGNCGQRPALAAKPDHQAFTRQKSFSRIQDVAGSDDDDDEEPADEDCSSMGDDAETPELYANKIHVSMATQRSVVSSSSFSSRKPPSRQTAIRGELELATLMPDNEELLVPQDVAAASSSTARSTARRNSSSISPHPSSRATTPNASSAATGGLSPLLQSSSENLQELVYVADVASFEVSLHHRPTCANHSLLRPSASTLGPGLDTRGASTLVSQEERSTAFSQPQHQQFHHRHHHCPH